MPFITHKSFWRGFFIFAICDLISFKTKNRKWNGIYFLLIYSLVLMFQNQLYKIAICFLGAIVYLLMKSKFKDPKLVFVFLISWISGISIGLPAPTLGLGLMFCYLLSQNLFILKWNHFLPLLTVLIFSHWVFGRLSSIHGEQDYTKLTFSIEESLFGGKGLKTSKENSQALFELRSFYNKYKDQTRSIVPDYPGFWAGADQLNPLISDWASPLELPTSVHLHFYIDSIKQLPYASIIIFAKYTASSLTRGQFEARPNSIFEEYIINNFKKINEGKYFEIYQKI